MRPSLGLALLALVAAARPARAETLPGLEIMVLGDYGDDQLPPRYRSAWWALCPGVAARLTPAKVSGRSVPNDIGPTIRVTSSSCAGAPLLVRAKDGLSERELPTATWTTSGKGLHKEIALSLASQRVVLRLAGAPEHEQWLEVRGDRRQRIAVAQEGGDWHADDWQLLWAGDLDGDGALDFAIRTVGDGDQIELFLSSRAHGARLVGKAASSFLGGC